MNQQRPQKKLKSTLADGRAEADGRRKGESERDIVCFELLNDVRSFGAILVVRFRNQTDSLNRSNRKFFFSNEK